MKAIWSPQARMDAIEYAKHIAKDKPHAAADWLDSVNEKADLAARFPQSGRVVPEFGREELRQLIVASHRLIYRVKANGVEIVRVFHTAKMLDEGDVADPVA